nr:response regulator transcription factor [uncultured Pedobacter sp.]
MKILIIEDEEEIRESIASYMQAEKYVCEFAHTLKVAIDKIVTYDYDCILLDLMLPDGNGLKVLEKIRALNKQDGVIIISANGSLEDKITGLNIGADDYLAKPFHLSELNARIYSVVRRKKFDNKNIMCYNELEINLQFKVAKVKGKEVLLTRKEFDFLLFLVGSKNMVVSKNAIAEHLSGDMADMMDNIDFVYAHAKNLKKKLTEAGCNNYVKTVYGVGYKFQV